MGRPKKGGKKPSPPPDDRVVIIHLKGSPKYAEWLNVAYAKKHIAKAVMFRLAMARWAQEEGLTPPPEM